MLACRMEDHLRTHIIQTELSVKSNYCALLRALIFLTNLSVFWGFVPLFVTFISVTASRDNKSALSVVVLNCIQWIDWLLEWLCDSAIPLNNSKYGNRRRFKRLIRTFFKNKYDSNYGNITLSRRSKNYVCCVRSIAFS